MKIKTILSLALIFQIYVNVAQTTFISTKSNYTFTIPSGWKNATKLEISDFAKQTGQTYDAIMYPSFKKEYDGPPLLLSIFKRKDMSPSEYEGWATELLKGFKTEMDKFVPKDLSDQIKSFKPGQGYYNKKSASLVYVYESEIKGFGKYFNIFTGFFTPKGMIVFQFTDRISTYTKNIDSYVKLVTSLKK